ncbi:hypothetical protein V1282_000887 [Nitrobacteraceae bacterium AZCC 2146]
MAFAAKKPTETEFIVPSLAEASPAYAELVARKTNLLASLQDAETQLRRDEVAFRARPSQMSEKVAVLVGDVAPGGSAYPTAALIREQQVMIAAIKQAKSVIETRLSAERGKASLAVCDQVRGEHRRLVRDMCAKLMDLRESMLAYQTLADALNDKDIAWSPLSPSQLLALGHPLDSQSRLAMYLRDKAKDGFLDLKEIPAKFR